jgi:hypothetical protein
MRGGHGETGGLVSWQGCMGHGVFGRTSKVLLVPAIPYYSLICTGGQSLVSLTDTQGLATHGEYPTPVTKILKTPCGWPTPNRLIGSCGLAAHRA